MYSNNISTALKNTCFDPERPIPQREMSDRFWKSGVLEFLKEESKRVRAAVALSYRNFKVGCAVYAFKEKGALDAGERFRVFTGANVKLASDAQNICAERVAIEAARHQGYSHIVGLVVVGETQPDSASGKETPTLHPCEHCRQYMHEVSLVNDSTVIITMSPDEKIQEQHSIRELLAMHSS